MGPSLENTVGAAKPPNPVIRVSGEWSNLYAVLRYHAELQLLFDLPIQDVPVELNEPISPADHNICLN